jgi:hypothetical protein
MVAAALATVHLTVNQLRQEMREVMRELLMSATQSETSSPASNRWSTAMGAVVSTADHRARPVSHGRERDGFFYF